MVRIPALGSRNPARSSTIQAHPPEEPRPGHIQGPRRAGNVPYFGKLTNHRLPTGSGPDCRSGTQACLGSPAGRLSDRAAGEQPCRRDPGDMNTNLIIASPVRYDITSRRGIRALVAVPVIGAAATAVSGIAAIAVAGVAGALYAGGSTSPASLWAGALLHRGLPHKSPAAPGGMLRPHRGRRRAGRHPPQGPGGAPALRGGHHAMGPRHGVPQSCMATGPRQLRRCGVSWPRPSA